LVPFDAVSDDFSSGTVNPQWTFSGAAGTAQIGTSPTDSFVAISSPSGVPVSASDVLTTPRLMQDVTNGDFQISAGFLSEPGEAYQEHGLLMVADDENWIRFDLARTPSSLRLIVGVVEDGETTYPLFAKVQSGQVTDFRVTRVGDTFNFEYSSNGADWTTAFSLDHQIDITEAGVFAGSASYQGTAPGYTAKVDYFENSADPILNEDGSYVPANLAPEASSDDFYTPLGAPLQIDAADLLANDSDPNLDSLTVSGLTQPGHGTIASDGEGGWIYSPEAGFEGTDTFTYTVTDGELTDTASVSVLVGNPIDVWYGLDQSFGTPGEAQSWINILGNVSGDVTSLSYTLNGGTPVALSVGPDTRRLQDNGDFNIDIIYDDLDGSPVDDVIEISAQLADGSTWTRQVTVDYEDGAHWNPNYAIDWATVTDIQQVLQVADGTWTHDASGVRPVDLGYDRLLVLGDSDWDNYTLNLTITMNDLENVDPRGRDGGAFAIGMLWGGHTDQPISGWQPVSGYEPGASFFYTDRFESHSYHSYGQVLGTQSFALEEGLTYNFTVQVEQVGIYDRLYSLKVWEVGTSEPVGWTLQGLETFSLDEAPATGGIYLNAHYFDVTFGDLTVTEITGSDILNGTDTNETLVAADTEAALPGQGEIDVFTGGAGADVFVFGANGTVYYDDGNASSSGVEDYGFVWDFESGVDQIRLAGSAGDYTLTTNAPDLTPGTAIWLTGQNGAESELIGVLRNVSGLSLESEDFLYDTLV
ncbi:cadherin-like domain-containing protein, partial [Frigidibacter sp. ROC022]|uniref:cadherin-like domain-containing protein n=1 Tax=Frigidibacter sp. ROC022 TaxID=2971796 RepID=UPI00215A6434